ncbi:MAG: hypothetical protein JXR70_17650 [Spirochaetales bacterium]|nr:hypothetical protein [Spirochaetales bacterium]
MIKKSSFFRSYADHYVSITFFTLKPGILNYILFSVYLVLIIIFLLLLNRYYCSYCINFVNPLNSVKGEVHKRFFESNIVINDAWKKILSAKAYSRFGGILVRSENFVAKHQGRVDDISIQDQAATIPVRVIVEVD